MKLTGGPNPWASQTTEEYASYPVLEGSKSCDVLVIGGGISGALVSYILSKQGTDVILLEKNTVGSGSTSASTGLLQFMNDDSLTDLIGRFGEERASKFYSLCAQAVDRLASVAAELPDDIGFRRRSSMYYASTEQDVQMLRTEYDNLIRYGFDVEFWDQKQISARFPFSKPAALYSRKDAEVNPYHMVKALLARSHAEHGLQIYEHSKVTGVDYVNAGAVALTENGEIKAKTVIWAMGYETQDWKQDEAAVLEYSYAIMTPPVPDLSSWHEQAMIWETERPYLYLRTTPDNRIIAGGLDEPLSKGGLTADITTARSQQLLDEVRALFPGLGDITAEYSWSGIFGSTRDGMPLIGRHPEFPNSYFIEGYGGNGTVYSMIAADLMAQAVSGHEPEELSWFPLTRSHFKDTAI
ncbi:NAD(P)/FAD-dependent oxidoreductase [Paenibacillus lemnae]|uniref:FAD-binding oxidoreductase n=1 Tax=Paenibacillus lemnae TaxID=1330551 RepID=A0A848M789_PAELE|nr:FAD-dependent oxidoreductase [Paenibacillus lemnae]NMO96060.1 FAD-binding oxidoreductase [Paenibacillus lemnae]